MDGIGLAQWICRNKGLVAVIIASGDAAKDAVMQAHAPRMSLQSHTCTG
jgi:hypothetical protein